MKQSISEKKQEQENSVEQLFEKKAVEQDNNAFQKVSRRLFVTAVAACSALIACLYFLSPFSRVQALNIKGNHYLPSSYIQKISGISLKSAYYLTFPLSVESSLKEDPFIQDASVTMESDNIISISVIEKKPVGYRYDSDQPILLFSDGTTADLTSDYMPVLSQIPMITGFDDDNQTHLLTKAFQDVNESIIEEMSQISQYTLSYDNEALEIQMRDGNIFFASYYSLDLINQYDQLAALKKNDKYCFYANEGASVVYSAACPWDAVPVTHDYWTDENGNYITNKWGDKAVKHYYKDDNGNYYLDENNYWILIPIDEYGNDDPDPEFLQHYLAGYYATGKLVIPADDTNGDGTIDEKDNHVQIDTNGDGVINQKDRPMIDTNGDGVLDENDTVLSDVNGDGVIDLNDLSGAVQSPSENTDDESAQKDDNAQQNTQNEQDG